MAGEFGLVITPWNLAKGGGELLERASGEVGIDHVVIPAVTGEQVSLRLTLQPETPAFHTEGGWHFPPQAKLYAAAPVRPKAARWLGTRDPLAAAREQTRRLGVRLCLRIDLPAVRTLVEQAPQMRVRSAWGDLPGFAPCPSNPDFRELLVAVLHDLTRYEPDAIEVAGLRLEPWTPATPTRDISDWLPAVSGATMCFCAACRQVATLAGIDADRVAHTARETALHWATSASGATDGADGTRRNESVAAYQTARLTALQSWLTRIAETHAGRRMLLVADAADGAAHEATLAPATWRTLCAVARDRVAALSSGPDEENAQHLGRNSPATRYAGYCLPVWAPMGFRPDGYVQLVRSICESSETVIDFEGLEEAPAAAVTWLKQAVRYARRQ